MILSRLIKRYQIGRFTADNRGVAAVEFGLIVPVLLVMMLGSIEAGRAITVARKFHYVTAMASDLIARENSMSDLDLEGVANAVKTAWAPNTLATFRMEVIAARAPLPPLNGSAPGPIFVDWSKGFFGAGATAQCSPYTTPANMIAPGSSAIFVTATFSYTTLFGAAVPGFSATMPFNASSAHSPRQPCVNGPGQSNCSSTCPN